MESNGSTPRIFEFSSGSLCLDFTNTIGDRPNRRGEKIAGFAELLRWSAEAGIVDEDQRDRLAREAARRPGPSRAFFRRAIERRERIYRIFSSLAGGRRPQTTDLDELNRDLARALRHLRVEPAGEGFTWSWTPGGGFDGLQWPVARSAGKLLTSSESRRVRECASDRCSWLFVDGSRTGRRRWCDMKVCGNRAKARRYYQKKKRASR